MTGLERLKSFASKPFVEFLIAASILLSILLACYSKNFGSYFLADDFGNVSYVSKICEGDWLRLLSNFTGPAMGLPAMNVYRPGLITFLTIDYALWKTNAFGHLLTNFLFVCGDTLLVYAVTRHLTRSWTNSRSFLVSLLSAGLFAANPLHCETVSWVAEGSDTVSCFFHLGSLLCFLKKGFSKNLPALSLGILFYWMAILTKEVGLILPGLLAAIAFILPDLLTNDHTTSSASPTPFSFVQRLVSSLKFSLPLWISAAAYFVIRHWALGTFIGGYTGSSGAELNAGVLGRLLNFNNFSKILFPLNQGVFAAGCSYHTDLKRFYLLLLALIVVRLVTQKLPWRLLSLIVVWFLASIAPIFQVWGLGPHMEGERFLFFTTVPLSIFLPICLLAPSKIANNKKIRQISDLAGLVALIGVVFFYGRITFKSNLPWVLAGDQTRACLNQSLDIAKGTQPDKKVILIGLPNERNGAHMILNNVTFSLMMEPPFAPSSYSERFVAFAPFSFGNADLINAQQLKRCAHNPSTTGLYAWDEDTLSFKAAPLAKDERLSTSISAPLHITLGSTSQLLPFTEGRGICSFENNELSVKDSSKGFGIVLTPLKVSPYDYDFLQFEIARTPSPKQEGLSVFWKKQGAETDKWISPTDGSDFALPPCKTETFQPVRLRLSKYWRWFAGGDISQIRIEFPSCSGLKLRNLQLCSGEALIPKISLPGSSEDSRGVCHANTKTIGVCIDAKSIPNCNKVQLEIFKPYFLVESISGNDAEDSAILRKITERGQTANITIPAETFPLSGLYQMRAYCLDKDDRLVGEKSDPVTIEIKN